MKTNLILISSWLTAEPWRLRAISMGILAALALAAGLLPPEAAIAGPASGGSH